LASGEGKSGDKEYSFDVVETVNLAGAKVLLSDETHHSSPEF
jgi:hypothetical protein